MRFPAAGADACRGGWVVARMGAPGRLELDRCPDFAGVVNRCRDAVLALVDMPIGLPETPAQGDRPCDRAARRLLGRPRASSVFRVPARAQLGTGGGMSRQAAALLPRLREVDATLRARPGLQERIREGHPEVCFWALAGGRPLRHAKRTAAGREERRRLLAPWLPGYPALRDDAALRRSARALGAAPHDVLDALALAVAAARAAAGEALVLAGEPVRDAAGLRLEIVACRPVAVPPG